ncbi:hypothetical protein K7432_009308 [Basidiobolus ranarum]|uniref:Uncharacterized protein n=1 Tax=Basidiobolus ranarum TaxID=34480 RepID=A0ABR2VX94_9FUNG
MSMLAWINEQVFGGNKDISVADDCLSDDWVILPSSTIHWGSHKSRNPKSRADRMLFSPHSQHRIGRDITRSYLPSITDRDNLIKKLQNRESGHRLHWTSKTS